MPKRKNAAPLGNRLPRIPFIGGNDEGGGPLQVDRRHRIKLPPDAQLRPTCPDVWKEYDTHFPDNEHPLLSRVVLETVRRWSYLCAPPNAVWPESLPPLSPEVRSERILAFWLARLKEYAQLQAEIGELLNLVRPKLSPKERVSITERAVGELTHRDAVSVLSRLKRNLAGRPADKRPLALRALEVKMLHPDREWKQIGEDIRYDEAKYHQPFAETVPAEVRIVKHTLRKYGIRW